ncbi:MAG: putative glycolipid-binding domain-containing protein [Actinomycetes bacterium]
MAVRRTLCWVGDGAPRIEIAHVVVDGPTVVAEGTQMGAVYELRYRLDPAVLHLEIVRGTSAPRSATGGSVTVELGDADFFDLGWSPLFNSLPVLRDGLMAPGPARDYVMRWVDVPSLEVTESRQTYEPLGAGVVRFRSGDFTADIRFDSDSLVVEYPGIGRQITDD